MNMSTEESLLLKFFEDAVVALVLELDLSEIVTIMSIISYGFHGHTSPL